MTIKTNTKESGFEEFIEHELVRLHGHCFETSHVVIGHVKI